MYSIKPGRGPSLMGGVAGVLAALFGVVWTIVAVSTGGSMFALFGIVFIAMAMAGAGYNFYNATRRDRMSTFDIATGRDESDPVAHAFGHGESPDLSPQPPGAVRRFEGDFCPYCGSKVSGDFDFCPHCGKDI